MHSTGQFYPKGRKKQGRNKYRNRKKKWKTERQKKFNKVSGN